MTDQNISLLGAPACGKTTFLAALSIALNRLQSAGQGWNVVGADPASRIALVNLTMKLAENRAFPPQTPVGAVERYNWRLTGQAMRSVQRRWIGTKRELTDIQIGLQLADASGEMSKAEYSYEGRKDLIDTLADSGGIVFLFDPVLEARKGHAFSYIYNVVAELAERMISRNEFDKGTLPQYVAVCVSKFDDVRVLMTAEKLGMIVADPDDQHRFPRVPDYDAREFFVELCKILNAGDPELVLSTIERHFRKERVRYFVTSSIGFWVDPNTNVYDPQDMQNLLDEASAYDARIRGSVHPINVVEPLMWLASKVTGTETL
jgi:hypothetical protein